MDRGRHGPKLVASDLDSDSFGCRWLFVWTARFGQFAVVPKDRFDHQADYVSRALWCDFRSDLRTRISAISHYSPRPENRRRVRPSHRISELSISAFRGTPLRYALWRPSTGNCDWRHLRNLAFQARDVRKRIIESDSPWRLMGWTVNGRYRVTQTILSPLGKGGLVYSSSLSSSSS